MNKQFEILGIQLRCETIPEDGIITVGKRKDYWYNIHTFTEEQEKEWRLWCKDQLKDRDSKWYNYLDLRYGLPLSFKKQKGLL